MGYYISLREARFRIPADSKADALDALRAMWSSGRESRMTGFTKVIDDVTPTAHFYAWMNGTTLSRGTCPSFEQGMMEWGYPVDTDEDGNVVGIRLTNEKIGDEDQMFAAIAPFVEAGSYIEVQGEDGTIWRWAFDGSTLREVYGAVTFGGES